MAGRTKRPLAWSVGFNVTLEGPASTLEAVTVLTGAAAKVRAGGFSCSLSHIQANERHRFDGPVPRAVLPGDVILPGQPDPVALETALHGDLIGVMAPAETDLAPSYAITFTLTVREPEIVDAGAAIQEARRIIGWFADAGVTCHVQNVNATKESPDITGILPDVAREIARAMNKGSGGEDWKDDADEGLAD